MKNELRGKIMAEFIAIRPKIYSYLTDDKNEKKIHKKVCRKKKLQFEFEDYKLCLERTQLENKINQLEKNKFDVKSLHESHK